MSNGRADAEPADPRPVVSWKYLCPSGDYAKLIYNQTREICNRYTENHMFPMVPYHALPALHKDLLFDFPQASPSFRAAIKELVSALIEQGRDPNYTIVRPLPETARPYEFGLTNKFEQGC